MTALRLAENEDLPPEFTFRHRRLLVDIVAVRCLRSTVALVLRDCRRTLVEPMDASSRRDSICMLATVG